jgi:hypothetical protein
MAQACEPALTDALERLLACAEEGLHPEGVLQDIRVLLSKRGLLLCSSVTDQVTEATPLSTDPALPTQTAGASTRN